VVGTIALAGFRSGCSHHRLASEHFGLMISVRRVLQDGIVGFIRTLFARKVVGGSAVHLRRRD
jgi:hypothetical protein